MFEPLAYVRPLVPDNDPAPVVVLDDQNAPILIPLFGDLLAAYLVNVGDHFDYVQGRDLSERDLSATALHSLAVSNLARITEGKVVLRKASPIHALTFDGNFDASLILLDELWEVALRDYYVDAPIVAIPSRDVLAFTDNHCQAGVDELQAVVRRVWSGGDHLLTQKLYVRDHGSWSPLSG